MVREARETARGGSDAQRAVGLDVEVLRTPARRDETDRTFAVAGDRGSRDRRARDVRAEDAYGRVLAEELDGP